jgi:heme/copper-type cytochrome/quinol oxidase subunit 4
LSSYCIAVRKEAFFCVGGFDEAVQTPSLEDEHLGIALYNGGFNILLAKDIQVEHLERYDLQKILRRMFTMGREKIEHFSKNPKTRGMKLSKSHHPISFLISIMLSPLIPFLLVMFMIISEMTSLKTFLGYSVFGLSLAFLLINISFFRFLYHKKGFLFMGKGVCYYYLMCFAVLFGFMYGRIRYMIRK